MRITSDSLALFVLPYKTHLDPPEQPLGSLLKTQIPGVIYQEIYETTDDHDIGTNQNTGTKGT